MIKALATDVDGVITKIESAWRYVHERLGLLEKAKKNAELFHKGKISYRKWAELDIELWKGIREEEFNRILMEVEIRKGCEEFFNFLKSKKIKIIAISGGLQNLLEILAKKFGFDRYVANEIIFENGILQGSFKLRITPRNKGIVLKRILKELNIKSEECIAIGDSDFDIPMLETCGYRIAFNPKSIEVMKIANECIISETFDELLFRMKKLLDPY